MAEAPIGSHGRLQSILPSRSLLEISSQWFLELNYRLYPAEQPRTSGPARLPFPSAPAWRGYFWPVDRSDQANYVADKRPWWPTIKATKLAVEETLFLLNWFRSSPPAPTGCNATARRVGAVAVASLPPSSRPPPCPLAAAVAAVRSALLESTAQSF